MERLANRSPNPPDAQLPRFEEDVASGKLVTISKKYTSQNHNWCCNGQGNEFAEVGGQGAQELGQAVAIGTP